MRLLCFALALPLAACVSSEEDEQASGVQGLDETAPASSRRAAPLDLYQANEYIDVRGVGDSGWSNTHEHQPMAAGFGGAVDRFDPSGDAYRGDLSFINWETVVGSSCDQFWAGQGPRSFAFVSRPANLIQARKRGFDLIGLSNNHARDCYASPETKERGEAAGPDMTMRAIAALGTQDWLVAGVSQNPAAVVVRTFQRKGRALRVAFASLYSGRSTCPNATCLGDADTLMKSFAQSGADLKILALHSMGPEDQAQSAALGARFIREHDGDVVFGHGPHIWQPVRVVGKNGGGKGVVFESLGNFIHPSLSAQSNNYIGRALFDRSTLKLQQVQVLPVQNSGPSGAHSWARWSPAAGTSVPSNLRWSRMPHGAYANVKP